MTTVINFNILNFFRPGLDRYALHDTRLDNQPAEEKHNSSYGKNRIIDVTQSTRAVTHEGGPDPYVRNAHLALSVVPSPRMIETYDRRGRSVQVISQKGLHVDSYI